MSGIDTTTSEFELMEKVRHFPGLLDMRSPNNGVFTALGITTAPKAGNYSKWKLLLKHAAETTPDFEDRAALIAPKGLYWTGVQHTAYRPYSKPPEIVAARDGDEIPEELTLSGDFSREIGGQGIDFRAFGTDLSLDSVGYGLVYVLVGYDTDKERPFAQKYKAGSVFHVVSGETSLSGPKEIRIHETEDEIWRLLRAENFSSSGDDGYAVKEVYYKDDRGEYPDIGSPNDSSSMYPHREIPMVAWPTGTLERADLSLPPMWACALQDRLLVNLGSDIEFATRMANTFMRFAAGIPTKTQEDWANVGPNIFYATSAPKTEASMEWLHLPAESITAGMELQETLVRAIEIGTLSPLLTKQGGNERATGQSIDAARARTVAEGYSLQHSAALSQIYTLARVWIEKDKEPDDLRVRVKLQHDFVTSGLQIDGANLLAKAYASGDMEASEFWGEMCRYGVISEEIDLSVLAKHNRDKNPEAQKVNAEKAKVLVTAMSEGAFSGKSGREKLYDSLKWLNCLPESFDSAQAAHDDEAMGMPMSQSLLPARAALGSFGTDPDEGA